MTGTLMHSLLFIGLMATATVAAPSPALLGGEGHGMLVEAGEAIATTAAPAAQLIGGDDRGIYTPDTDTADVIGLPAIVTLGGDDHGMLNTPETTAPPSATILGGDSHGQRISEEDAAEPAEFHLHQSEFTAAALADTDIMDLRVDFDLANGTVADPFDWSVTRYLNGSVCYADGDSDGDLERCYSAWWYYASMFASHFVFAMMVLVIVMQAMTISRRTRALNALSLQLASILVDTHTNGNLNGGDADNVGLLVPPAYPQYDVSKLGGGSRYTTQSEA